MYTVTSNASNIILDLVHVLKTLPFEIKMYKPMPAMDNYRQWTKQFLIYYLYMDLFSISAGNITRNGDITKLLTAGGGLSLNFAVE